MNSLEQCSHHSWKKRGFQERVLLPPTQRKYKQCQRLTGVARNEGDILIFQQLGGGGLKHLIWGGERSG